MSVSCFSPTKPSIWFHLSGSSLQNFYSPEQFSALSAVRMHLLVNLGTPVIKEFVSMTLLCAFILLLHISDSFFFNKNKFCATASTSPADRREKQSTGAVTIFEQLQLSSDNTLSRSPGPARALGSLKGRGAPALTQGSAEGPGRVPRGTRAGGRGGRGRPAWGWGAAGGAGAALLTCGLPRRTAPAGNQPPAAGSPPRPPPWRSDTSAATGRRRTASGAGLRPQRRPAARRRPCACWVMENRQNKSQPREKEQKAISAVRAGSSSGVPAGRARQQLCCAARGGPRAAAPFGAVAAGPGL